MSYLTGGLEPGDINDRLHCGNLYLGVICSMQTVFGKLFTEDKLICFTLLTECSKHETNHVYHFSFPCLARNYVVWMIYLKVEYKSEYEDHNLITNVICKNKEQTRNLFEWFRAIAFCYWKHFYALTNSCYICLSKLHLAGFFYPYVLFRNLQ